MLTGPAYLWYTNLIAAGVRGPFMAPGEEIALLGMVILWLASVRALRLAASTALRNQSAVVQESRFGVASGI